MVYVLTLMDRFSRYVDAVPIPDKSAETVAFALLENWICYYGVPKQMISDRGGEFIGRIMKLTARPLGIQQLFTTSHMPSTNGMVERFHRYLKMRLRVRSSERTLNLDPGDSNWNVFLPYIVWSYNSTTNKMTGHSPNQLMFAQAPNDPLDAVS